jgi:hypothetical protein
MTAEGQQNRSLCKFFDARVNGLKRSLSHNIRRAKYWNRVANKWYMKMQKAAI